MSEARVATLCEQCGQTDDHPKIHLGAVTKHHDCLSFAEEQQVRSSSFADPSEEGAVDPGAIIDACKGGKRGADLLKHIEKLAKETSK